jgi:hypothetical protein
MQIVNDFIYRTSISCTAVRSSPWVVLQRASDGVHTCFRQSVLYDEHRLPGCFVADERVTLCGNGLGG